MSGDQFAPIDKPYLRLWQQRMAAEELARSIKAARRKLDAKPRKKGKRARK